MTFFNPFTQKPGGHSWFAVDFAAATGLQLKKLVATIKGAQAASAGEAAGSLGKPLAALSGFKGQAGTLATQTKPLTTAFGGTAASPGDLSVSLGGLNASLSNYPRGGLSAAAPRLIAALAGAQSANGTIAAALRATSAVLAATQNVGAGSAAMVLSQTVAALAGAQAQSGGLSGALLTAITALAGTVAAPSSIAFIGSAAAAADTVAMPAHQPNDFLLVTVFRDGSTTAPTVPAGWTLSTGGAFGSATLLSYWMFAATTSDPTGTWTNATGIQVEVWRGVAAIGYWYGAAATGATISYPPIAMQDSASNKNWITRLAGARNATNLLTNTPAGYTARAGAATELRGIDTNGPVNVDPTSTTQSTDGTSDWISETIELVALGTATSFSEPFSSGTAPDPAAWVSVPAWQLLPASTVGSGICTIHAPASIWQTTGIATKQAFLLTGKTVTFRIPSAAPATNAFYFGVYAGDVTSGASAAALVVVIFGSNADVILGAGLLGPGSSTRTHTAGDWYRLRDDGAGVVHIETSTNGSSWSAWQTASSRNPPYGRIFASNLSVGGSDDLQVDDISLS